MRHDRSPRRSWSRAAILALPAFASCHNGVPGAELVDEPWRTSAAGRIALTSDLGVGNKHAVSSTLEVQDPNFPVETVSLAGELDGVFAGGLGVEYFVFDDVSLNLGAEYRVFDPDVSVDEFSFGTMEQFEYFLTLRYLLPVRWLDSERLRPFVMTKLAYIPSVDFDLTTAFDLPDPLNDLVLTSPYSGGAYWSLALGAGLAYQFADSFVGRLGVVYEWAITQSMESIPTDRTNSTGNPTIDEFLDGVFQDLEFEVTLEPRGLVAYVGLLWYP